jgi:hypothetical protein
MLKIKNTHNRKKEPLPEGSSPFIYLLTLDSLALFQSEARHRIEVEVAEIAVLGLIVAAARDHRSVVRAENAIWIEEAHASLFGALTQARLETAVGRDAADGNCVAGVNRAACIRTICSYTEATAPPMMT